MRSMTRRCTSLAARSSAAIAIALLIAATAQADPLDTLVASYPDKIARRNGNTLVFRDGMRMDAGASDPHKPFDKLLRDASILDQSRLTYPRGTAIAPPAKDFDPGRFRNEVFFSALYGDCRHAKPHFVPVRWVSGEKVLFARANGAAAHLEAVAADIEKLPPSIQREAYPTAGTYVCRPVEDTGRLSMHAYGAAIDLNLKYSNYWLWEAKGAGNIPFRNAIPREIVDIFERHGFIWGGRWYHYDTMHFEYRPELLAASPAPR
jgi:D-alanyl-D-alanine carboxypeptidase